MLQLSELFPRGKLKHVRSEGKDSELNINILWKKALLSCLYICFLRRGVPVLSRPLKLKRQPQREKLNYHLMSLRTKAAALQVENWLSAPGAIALIWSWLCSMFQSKLLCH